MKQFKWQIFPVLTLLVAAGCSSSGKLSQSLVTPLDQMTGVPEGSLVYSLPLTIFDIIVETERVIEKPGPYSRYAEELLGLKEVIRDESEFWTITGITMKSHDEPDPSEYYIIESSSVFQTNALLLRKSGLILDLNPATLDETTEKDRARMADPDKLRILDLGADEYFQESRDTVYKLVSLDTSFVNVPYLVERKQKLTLGELAEKAALRLMELRDGKHLILTGEANVFPQDGSSIAELNRLEKEYTELFTGKSIKETQRFYYQVIPRKEQAGQKITLCLFSEATGPSVTTGKTTGIPLVIEFVPEEKTKNLTVVPSSGSDSSKPVRDKLYYRVPDMVNVRITLGNDVFNSSRRLIYQFGEIIQLPSNYIIGK